MKRAQLRLHFTYVLLDAQNRPTYVGMSRYHYRLSTHERAPADAVCVAHGLTKNAAFALEALLIGICRHYSPSTMQNKAVSRTRGWKQSAHQKAVVSATHRGKVMSPETREKLRQAHLGKPLSAEHRAKIGAAGRGKKRAPFTEEHKERIRQAALRRVPRVFSEAHKANLRKAALQRAARERSK